MNNTNNPYEKVKMFREELRNRVIRYRKTYPAWDRPNSPWLTGRDIIRGADGDLLTGSAQFQILDDDRVEEARDLAKKYGLKIY